jgi:hypothetical protein
MYMPEHERRPQGGDTDPLTNDRGLETVTRLKRQIALREYRVDSDAVAREILSKLRLIGISRRELLAGSEPGRQPAPGERS